MSPADSRYADTSCRTETTFGGASRNSLLVGGPDALVLTVAVAIDRERWKVRNGSVSTTRARPPASSGTPGYRSWMSCPGVAPGTTTPRSKMPAAVAAMSIV